MLTIDETWEYAIFKLLEQPLIPSRNGMMKEIIGYKATLDDLAFTVLANPIRKMSLSYACAEFFWYMSNTKDTHMLEAYAPSYQKFAEDHVAYGAYGPRIMKQLEPILDILTYDQNTRQAVLLVWLNDDITKVGLVKDLPCTVQLQFFIRDHMLHCVSYMRSNDVWLGMPYDIFCFTTLQRIMAHELNVAYGSYTHMVGSLHLYEKNVIKAAEALRNHHDILPHEYSDEHTLFDDMNLALKAEMFYRMQPAGFFPEVIKQPMLVDMVCACRHKFQPGDYLFYSKAFNGWSVNSQ